MFLKKRIASLEARINELEARVRELERQMLVVGRYVTEKALEEARAERIKRSEVAQRLEKMKKAKEK